ncbi:hypothetical protein G4B88_010513 [Cannabis sativa]|uniref:Coilin tudor domain-containing protein n=3 Tax=Cannabis sativa TaxID=3483 RepID=A0A7J6I7P6_CANSA|nr:hypothetical protein G4B88_010513 [Cannabis sativa]
MAKTESLFPRSSQSLLLTLLFTSTQQRTNFSSPPLEQLRIQLALGDQFPEGERYFGLESFGNTCYCNSVLQLDVQEDQSLVIVIVLDRRKSNKLVNVEDVPSDVQPEENESSQQDSLPEKSPVKKDKSSDMDSESDDSSTQKIDEKADNIMEFTPRKPRHKYLKQIISKDQWNGITSKKKGQQWGKEKTDFHKRNDLKKENPGCSDMLVNEEEEKEDQEKTTVDVPIDFDKLKPCSTLPQVGNTVAYRLVELSASWTPVFFVVVVFCLNRASEMLSVIQTYRC